MAKRHHRENNIGIGENQQAENEAKERNIGVAAMK
jgi:hypothetical protein